MTSEFSLPTCYLTFDFSMYPPLFSLKHIHSYRESAVYTIIEFEAYHGLYSQQHNSS